MSMLFFPLNETDVAQEISGELENIVEGVKNMGIRGVGVQLWEKAKEFLPHLLTGVIFFIVGLCLLYIIIKLIKKALDKSKIEKALHYFIITIIKYILLGIIIITFLGVLGFPITPIITALGAAGLALSLAVQDSLSNLAGGIFLLFNRPFATGDFIELNGISGTVKEIRLVYTVIRTVDNRNVHMPNGDFSKAVITNYSAEPVRRLDLVFPVKIDSDIDAAVRIIKETLKESNMALYDPEPVVMVSDLTYTVIKISCLVWVESGNLSGLKAYMLQNAGKKLKANEN